MKNHFVLTVIIALLASAKLYAQHSDLNALRDWRIYDSGRLGTAKTYTYPVDSLTSLRNAQLDQDSLSLYLTHATVWVVKQPVYWQGSILCSAIGSAGDVHKILVSYYGGFFFDATEQIYYIVSEDVKQAWTNFIIRNKLKFSS